MKKISCNTIEAIDCRKGLKSLPDNCIQSCVTSPPYFRLRDYGVKGQVGLEESPQQYVAELVEIFQEVKRVLRPDGTLWLNLGDAYWGSGKAGTNPLYQQRHIEFGKAGREQSCFGRPTIGKHSYLKPKDLIGLPWMVAFALRDAGWWLRQDVVWHKINPTPESVIDRCTKAHEYIFLLSKNKKYYFDHEAIKTPAKAKTTHDLVSRPTKKSVDNPLVSCFRKQRGPYLAANRRSVWSLSSKPFKGAHFAVFPPEIPELCIKAGTKEGDIVLDPFMGSGTTALVAQRLGRQYIGFELNPEYVTMANMRLEKQNGSWNNQTENQQSYT